MILKRLLSVLALVFGGIVTCDASLATYPFQVTSTNRGATQELHAINQGPAPVWVRVTLKEGNNVVTDTPWPIATLVPPGATITLATVSAIDARSGFNYRVSTAFSLGDPMAQPDPNATYRVPYGTDRSFVISQAPGGRLTTHTTEASAEAVDFNLPEGTPVVAARAGVIIDADLSHTRSGQNDDLLDKANSIRILHSDGTIALYAHLKAAAPIVRRGDRVRAGQQIAWSGNTGYSSGPHLHFAVLRNAPASDGRTKMESIPVVFRVGDSIVTPNQGAKLSGTGAKALENQSRQPERGKETKTPPAPGPSPGIPANPTATIRTWATSRPPLFWWLMALLAVLLVLLGRVVTAILASTPTEPACGGGRGGI